MVHHATLPKSSPLLHCSASIASFIIALRFKKFMPGIGYDYYKSKKNVTLTSRLLDPISRLGVERKLGRGETHQLRFTI